MQFHCAFVRSELGPGKKRQTQIDGGGVQGIGALIQFDTEGIVGVEAARLADEKEGNNRCESPEVAVIDGVEMSEEGWQVDKYRFADGAVPIRN